MRLPLFIALRLFNAKKDNSRISRIAIRVATIGVALGLTVMLVSLCIFYGYKYEIQSKITGLGGHLIIQSPNMQYDGTTSPISFSEKQKNFLQAKNPEIKTIQKYSLINGIFKTKDSFYGLSFKGVASNYDFNFIKAHLVDGAIPVIRENESSKPVIISQNVAQTLHLSVGDKVFSYFFEDGIRIRRLTIVAIYKTNLSVFDNHTAFVPIIFVKKLNKWATDTCSGVEIVLRDADCMLQVQKKCSSILSSEFKESNYTVTNIKEQYPQLFNWLQLMNMDVCVILILMFLVAGFTMISGLLILILENIRTIGILKTLGSTDGMIRKTFIYYSLLVLVRSMIWGNILSLVIVGLQSQFHLVGLDPDKYYVEYVPININWLSWLILNVGTFFLTLLILIIPSLLVTRISPARTIRIE